MKKVKKSKYFYCYDRKLQKFLICEGFEFVIRAFTKDGSKIVVFEKSYELQKVLDEFNKEVMHYAK